jgi:hypothetical protein
MRILETPLLVAIVAVAMAGFAGSSGLIEPGNKLEVRFSGPGYSVLQLSVVESNGVIHLGDSTFVPVQGMSTNEASIALCESLYISEGKTNLIRSASVRKIAPLPFSVFQSNGLALSVFRSDGSNLVFRLTNTPSNSFRLPSTGYVTSASYMSVNTNPAFALFDKPEAHIGLWLTRNWRYVGSNWMWASQEAWKDRLKIQTLDPGEHLDVNHPFAEDITSNTVFRFNFQISHEWAEYGLWEGNFSVTGLTKEMTK